MTALSITSKTNRPIFPLNVAFGDLVPASKELRKHSRRQIAQLCASIAEFGFTNPILVDERLQIIAGHARYVAARDLGMAEVPCLQVGHLEAKQKRALAIADNRIAELAIWDEELLRQELEALLEVDFDVEALGFTTAEIDVLLDGAGASTIADPDDDVPDLGPVVTRTGDLWCLSQHRVYCGSSVESASYERLLAGEKAQLIVADPPYNVPVAGHVSGLGRNHHAEFAMASGEMSRAQFIDFLTVNFTLLAQHSIDGSIHYQFMDWRHMDEMLAAGAAAYTDLKNLCVWSKTNAGMGSLYRSKHELVFVWKSGSAPHINNVELGKNGRYRTNVWEYAGANTFKRGRDEELAMHPTVKPVALIADAIRDCSKVGGLVLDPFGGSGTTLVAAERTKRRAALIEIEPRYVDTTIERWQKVTGQSAVLHATGQTFAEVAADRAGEGRSIHG